MNIQLIGSNWGNRVDFNGIVQSPLSNPRSLDEFDVNIIDLSCESLWYYTGVTPNKVNESNHLVSIRHMVCNSEKANTVYVLPKSIELQYNALNGRYYGSILIKDDLESIRKNILCQVFQPQLPPYALLFENTRTEINGIEYVADFYFMNGMQAKTKSRLSNKITTVSLDDRVLATTLDITYSLEKLVNFVDYFFKNDETDDFPSWFSTIRFYDDVLQEEIINERRKEIARAEQAIGDATAKLLENSKYKSILYTNGARLVQIVFNILEQLLCCDLSEFEDKKNEDFLIRLDHCTLIGEIKGVTSNVKNDHIGQIEHHYQRYMDELEEQEITEKVHQVLVISPFRTKEPSVREPVNEKQIKLAERNGCLIIETETLLKVFEGYLEGRITPDNCIEVFCNKTGLLQITDLLIEPQGELEDFKV